MYINTDHLKVNLWECLNDAVTEEIADLKKCGAVERANELREWQKKFHREMAVKTAFPLQEISLQPHEDGWLISLFSAESCFTGALEILVHKDGSVTHQNTVQYIYED